MSHLYSLYGLVVQSELRIPGAPSATEGAPCVWQVLRGQPADWDLRDPETVFVSEGEGDEAPPEFSIVRHSGGVLAWAWRDGIRFWVDPSHCIILADWPPGESEESAAYYLAGPVLAQVLRSQGATLLHGSVVARGSNTIAFVGDSGAGKSTLAAAMVVHAGCRTITDDVIRLEHLDGAWHVHPGYAGHRLWPESAPAVGLSEAQLPKLLSRSDAWPGWDKRFLDLNSGGQHNERIARPLTHVYVLMPWGEKASIEEISPASRLMDLDRHAFQHWFRDGATARRDLAALASLIGHCRVSRFTAMDDVHRLPESIDFLLRDIES